MLLSRLELDYFRNYRRLRLELAPGSTLLVGGNAQGKTNLLEAVYYLSRGHPPSAAPAAELVSWAAPEELPVPFARVLAQLQGGAGACTLEAVLQLQPGEGSPRRVRRRLRVDGVARRLSEFRGRLLTVLFAPQDLDLVSGAASLRRRFLDDLLTQLRPPALEWQGRYAGALRQRNRLLKLLRAQRGDARQLEQWDALLSQAGAALLYERLGLAGRLAAPAAELHQRLSAPGQSLALRYRASFSLPPWQSRLGQQEALPSLAELQQAFLTALDRRRALEIQRGMTLTGPHRDDLLLLLAGRELSRFGSRGQQRTAALALKLAEAHLLAAERGQPPILLLDDVFSELDAARRERVLASLPRWEQVLLTATDTTGLPQRLLQESAVAAVQDGQVLPASPSPSLSTRPPHVVTH